MRIDPPDTILVTAPPPPRLLAAPGVRLDTPVRPPRPGEPEPGPPPFALTLPRLTFPAVPGLARALAGLPAGGVLHVHPADARELLAVAEVWQLDGPPGQRRVWRVSLYPDRSPADRRRGLARALAGLPAPSPADLAAAVAGLVRWRVWELGYFRSGRRPAWAGYLAGLELMSRPGPEPGPPPPPPLPQPGGRPRERVAVWCDWLQEPGVFEALEAAGQGVVWVGRTASLTAWPGGRGGDAAWCRHPFFTPLTERLGALRRELVARRAARLISVTASGSVESALARICLPRLGWPLLMLESECPGRLTAGDRIRLENFLALPADRVAGGGGDGNPTRFS